MEDSSRQQAAPVEYHGKADDIARLAIQRLMIADSAARAHQRSARIWHRIRIGFATFIAVSASLAAVSVVKDTPIISISLTVLIALLVPLQASLKVEETSVEEMNTASAFSTLANRLERFIQLDLGPQIWRGEWDMTTMNALYMKFEELDKDLEIELGKTPPVALTKGMVESSTSRGRHLANYMRSENVELPPTEAWANIRMKRK